MLFNEYININNLVLHQIGSNACQEGIHYSNELTYIDNDLKQLLKGHFLTPFKADEYYNFVHSSELELNEIYQYVTRIFSNKKDFWRYLKK